MPILTGRCLCRSVTFKTSAPPLHVLYCHCESCRRSTSSPVTTFLIVQKSTFRYTDGEPLRFQSSPGVQRSFCGRCGSPLAYETDQRPDHVDLYACSLDDPSSVSPQAHVHAEEQLPWCEILDELPRYARSPREGGPLRVGPREHGGSEGQLRSQ